MAHFDRKSESPTMTHSLLGSRCSTLAASLLLLGCMSFFTSRSIGTPQVGTAVKAVAKNVDDVLRWLKVIKGGAAQADVVDDLSRAVVNCSAAGTDLSDDVVRLLKRDIGKLAAGNIDEALLIMMSKNPKVCESAWNIAVRTGMRDVAPRVEILVKELGDKAPRLLKGIEQQFDVDNIVCFFKGMSGRQLSRRQVESFTDALRKTDLDSVAQGDAFECVGRAQFARGVQKSKTGLKDGSPVIGGKYNEANGIDGIGVTSNGTPVIFEFSMDRAKDLAKSSEPAQLSRAWTSDRWSRMIESQPATVQKLSDMGIDGKWLRAVRAEDIGSWSRKLVLANESAITNANRMAAELGPDDMFALGGN